MGVFEFEKRLNDADKSHMEREQDEQNLPGEDYWPEHFDELRWLSLSQTEPDLVRRQMACHRRKEIVEYAERELPLRGYEPIVSPKSRYSKTYWLGNSGIAFYCPGACTLVIMEKDEQQGLEGFRLEIKSLLQDKTEFTAEILDIERIYRDTVLSALGEFGCQFPSADEGKAADFWLGKGQKAAGQAPKKRSEPRPPQE